MADVTPQQARAIEETLWRRGDLRFLFGSLPILPPRVGVASLRAIYDWVMEKWGKGQPIFVLCHRRTGKTSVGFVVGGQLCIKHPRSRVAIVCDTKEHAVDLSKQIAAPIFDRCPEGVRPVWHETQRAWLFPNGSRIEMYGNEPNQTKRLRGGKFRAIIVEEARDLPHLETAVETVFKPALADTAGSQLMFASTVPEQEDTPCERYYRQADEAGAAYTLRLSENPDYPRSFYENEARAALGGEFGGAFQREYECVFMHEDDARLIVPEFTPPARLEIMREVPFQAHWRWYMGLDPGGLDPTGMAWVAYDERVNLAYVAKELQVRDLLTTAELAKLIRATELELFRGHHRPNRIERYADITDTQLIHNLNVDQGLDFRGSANDDLWGNMDNLRRAVQERTLAAAPDCKQLAWEMTHARRTNNGKQILRTKHGHADVLMAVYYVHRNLVRKPRPLQPTAPAQPLVEMGLVAPPGKTDIIRLLRRPFGEPELLPGMKRRTRF